MSFQLNFLLQKAASYLIEKNYESASLMLRQLLRLDPHNSEGLRLSAILASESGDHAKALEIVEKALHSNRRNGILHSNRGNILLKLGRIADAIDAYKRAIQYAPNYAEAYGNLGNALQEFGDYDSAKINYEKAIQIDPKNPSFYCHLGNAILATGNVIESEVAYKRAIQADAAHADAQYYLSLLRLQEFDFANGWDGSEWRWQANGFDSIKIRTSIKEWDGKTLGGNLLIWAEQGIGDQILYGSIFHDVEKLVNKVTVTVDEKLIPIFQRSFPKFHILGRNSSILENNFSAQISIGSLGRFFRKSREDFSSAKAPYLVANPELTDYFKKLDLFSKKICCGISWKSKNQIHGKNKSIHLDELEPIFSLSEKVNFINMQYGNVESEIQLCRQQKGIELKQVPDLDIFNDLESVLSAIEASDIILTTSNTTAHMAGALGKETLLLLPFSAGKFWYWHDINGISLWYPSIRVFKQTKQGDWSNPIQEVKTYLERRFEL